MFEGRDQNTLWTSKQEWKGFGLQAEDVKYKAATGIKAWEKWLIDWNWAMPSWSLRPNLLIEYVKLDIKMPKNKIITLTYYGSSSPKVYTLILLENKTKSVDQLSKNKFLKTKVILCVKMILESVANNYSQPMLSSHK